MRFDRTTTFAAILLLTGCGQDAPAGGTALPGMPGATAIPGAPAVPGMPVAPGVPAAPGIPGMPPGAPNPFAVLGQVAQMAQGMTAQPGGAIVNWRALAGALPAAVPGFEPRGDIDGRTEMIGGFSVSEAERDFVAGARRLEFKIVDTSMNPMLAMPFNMLRGMVVDSNDEIQRGSDVAGQPGVVRIRRRDLNGQQTVLAHGRFLVEVELEPAQTPEEVIALAGLVNYAALAQAAAAAQAAVPAPATATP
jgi:hypothetical protein